MGAHKTFLEYTFFIFYHKFVSDHFFSIFYIMHFCIKTKHIREAAKKVLLLMAGPLWRGLGGVKGLAIKENIPFFGTFFFQRSNFPTAIKLEGGGVRS